LAGENPDAVRGEYGVEGIGELACVIPDQGPDWSRAGAEVQQEVARCLRRPRAVGARGDVGQVATAGAVLDDDQGVDAAQEHGVHVDEIGREDAAGLRGQKLRSGRASAAEYRVGPGGVQDLPHRALALPWPAESSGRKVAHI
jgi:hypothetical protein